MKQGNKVNMDKVITAFDEFCDKKVSEKGIERDRKFLNAIGNDKLKKALSTMSLTVLYDFLHKQGFSGSRSRLIDLLKEMGIRDKKAKPYQFRFYKCSADGCDGRLIYNKSSDKDNIIYCCDKCKSFYKLEDNNIILIKQSVQEKKENVNNVIPIKPMEEKKSIIKDQGVIIHNNSSSVFQKPVINNSVVSQQNGNVEKPIEKPVEKPVASKHDITFDNMFKNSSNVQSDKQVNSMQAVFNKMQIENEDEFGSN